MKTVFISAPYSNGDSELNIQNTLIVCDALANAGFVPFNPLLLDTWHKAYPRTYEYWIEYTLFWMEKCDLVLRLDGESNGADGEVKRAKELGIPVYYSLTNLKINEK